MQALPATRVGTRVVRRCQCERWGGEILSVATGRAGGDTALILWPSGRITQELVSELEHIVTTHR